MAFFRYSMHRRKFGVRSLRWPGKLIRLISRHAYLIALRQRVPSASEVSRDRRQKRVHLHELGDRNMQGG